MFGLELLFLMQSVMVGILIILLKKMIQMRKQVDDIVKEVSDYISFVTEEVQQEAPDRIKEPQAIVRREKRNRDEEQNKLIQSVLGEYFI